MTKEFVRAIRMISKTALKQADGGYTTESDALTAIHLIIRLTDALLKEDLRVRKAKQLPH